MNYLFDFKQLKNVNLFIFCFVALLSSNSLLAQDYTSSSKKRSFIEYNLGVAYINDGFVFPGTSILWGQRFITENKFVFEYELGLAFPTIATGKIGIGVDLGPINVTAGLRPFPLNTYFQIAQSNGRRGNFLISFELSPAPLFENTLHDSYNGASFYSRGNINIGYRWNLN